MNKIEIENMIKEIIVEEAPIKVLKEEIKDSTHLIDDLGYDSILIVQLMLNLENKFLFLFEDEDIEDDTLTQYGKLATLVVNKVLDSHGN